MRISKHLTQLITLFLLLSIAACKKENQPAAKIQNNPAPVYVLATISTNAVTNNQGTSVLSGGNITSDNGSAITARGVCWSLVQTPTVADSKTSDSTGTGLFNGQLNGLIPDTTYYVRAYATNAAGTAYGNSVSFVTNTVDVDGNVYTSVTIGAQIWMVENLKTTHYSNGDALANVTDNAQWVNLSEGAYCDYNNTPANSLIYGRLYNYYTIDDPRNICPKGWRLPTNADWLQLETFLGGNNVAGAAMKEAGTTHWNTPNTGATNSSGFTGLPAGNRGAGGFYDMGNYAYFWADALSTYSRALLDNSASTSGISNNGSNLGLSIRCIKR